MEFDNVADNIDELLTLLWPYQKLERSGKLTPQLRGKMLKMIQEFFIGFHATDPEGQQKANENLLDIKDRPVDEIRMYIESLQNNDLDYPRRLKSLATERNAFLDKYEGRIKGYIEQSRKLMDTLPIKTRSIVEKLKVEQGQAYTELKKFARESKEVYDELRKYSSDAIYGNDFKYESIPMSINGEAVPLGRITHFAIVAPIRAFFVKFPSFMQGCKYDLIYGTYKNGVVSQKYLNVKNFSGRTYNFKYKAWWGPMTRIMQDYVTADRLNGMVIILRFVDCSSEMEAKILNTKGLISCYGFKTMDQYKRYCELLKKVRDLNFKVKATVQRFVRGGLSKFLNTDKKIVTEINNYTQILK